MMRASIWKEKLLMNLRKKTIKRGDLERKKEGFRRGSTMKNHNSLF